MKTRTVLFNLAFSAVLACGINLHAQTVALQGWSDGVGMQWGADAGYTFGWQFEANQTISVTSLGAYYLDTWTADHQVGIWSDFGTLLANVTVTSSDPEADGIRWVALGTPLVLSAGQTYRIGANYPGPVTDTFVYQAESVTTVPEITYLQSVNSDNTGFSFPVLAGVYNEAYFGPNFQFTPVPEPSTLALSAVSGLALLRFRRRK